jgi:hypothetical protein
MRAIALALLAVVVTAVLSAELQRDQSASLYMLAVGHAGYVPEKAPTVRLASRSKLCEIIGVQEPCNVRGVTDGDGIIWLDRQLDFSNALDSSVLLHEFVHYVQWAKGGAATDCTEWVRREHEAYRIQIYALERAGQQTLGPRMALQQLRCFD